ncbi:MAG: SIR2 family protein [Candidatus Saganbacteria bacterium]|nr:SIR2 family protein [Candidatus Saganbacteria bacterium]
MWDKNILEEIIEGFKKEKVYAFIGTGLSVSVGYPTWSDLIESLAEIYYAVPTISQDARDEFKDLIEKNSEQALKCLTLAKKEDERGFYAKIRTLFGARKSPNFNSNHIDLLSIDRLQGIITTNYDSCIEDAAASINKKFVKLNSLDEALSCSDFFVLHLHGELSDFNEMVVVGEDYSRFYSDDFRAKLRGFLLNNIVLYLGYSFNDVQIREVLEQKAYKEKQKCNPKDHFAVLPFEGKEPLVQRQIYKDNYGIKVQYYKKEDESHRNLQILLSTLKARFIPPSTFSDDIPRGG